MTTNMPLFILQLDSLPLDLRTFFRQKSLTIGNVTALCHKEILSKFCFFADEDDCVKMVVWKDSSISVIGEPFSVKKRRWKIKLDPSKRSKIFADPLSFLMFCTIASETLSKTFSCDVIDRKPVFFDFIGGKFYIRAENNKTFDISDLFLTKEKYRKSIQDRLKDILKRFFSGEICPTKEQTETEAIISMLDETELFILKYCIRNYSEKFTLSLSNLTRDFAGNVFITKAISRLCNIYVTQVGERIPLLMRRNDDKELYESNVLFQCTQLYKYPLPRLPLEVLDELGEPALKFYFTEKSVNPFDAELRWDALCALERLPVEFFRRFLNTKAGTNFLKCFSGDDAIYVKYILESVTEE